MDHIKYIPAWNGNREKENPITVEIRPLTRGEIAAYAKQIHRTQVKGFRDRYSDNAADVQERLFFDNVGRIENFVHPLTKKPITNARELYYEAPGCNSLITEIIEEIEENSSMKEDEIKNSAPPSGGA